ncbi:hypothetical protein IQ07DRAFT_616741 [Pyrenochaeta sp. DS3sAY3a]|nr:hypothetical protein IQ07DRAFT_616741 [Pyrenochaeta sp. DS3sAY3a]
MEIFSLAPFRRETVCISCRHRGVPCIGQDHPEEDHQVLFENNRDPLVSRIQRVELLLEQLIEIGQKVEKDIASTGPRLPERKTASGYDTPVSDAQTREWLHTPAESQALSGGQDICVIAEYRKLSEELVKAFPSQEDIDVFCKSNYLATFYCHQLFTKGADRPEHEAMHFVNEIAKIPDPTTTLPVQIAKRMIIFATFLQYFPPRHSRGLKEHPASIMDRLVETAVRLVTTNEKIITCIDGLECIVLEGVFHSNNGSLRRAWLAFRKAMVIAQLMKIDQQKPIPAPASDASNQIRPMFLWFRIVYMDSYLSLMLGLPHGGQDTNMENDIPGETPSCKLERAHTLIARKIIDRNRQESLFHDFTATRELDRELLMAARCLPDKFWLPPDYTGIQPNTKESFWEIMRLCDQLHHFNLVHLLHLPFLLRCEKESKDYAYAKITCVNASREILSRFISFRKSNSDMVGAYCRTADFFAFMAGMTVLLAHIDSHRLDVVDWRAHQRLGDRAMVEQLLQNLELVRQQRNDSLTHNSAEQLRRLLDIESDAARGIQHTAGNTVNSLEENCGELQLSIPYFGIIKIGRYGITRDEPNDTSSGPAIPINMPSSVHAANHLFSAAGLDATPHLDPLMQMFLRPVLTCEDREEGDAMEATLHLPDRRRLEYNFVTQGCI